MGHELSVGPRPAAGPILVAGPKPAAGPKLAVAPGALEPAVSDPKL